MPLTRRLLTLAARATAALCLAGGAVPPAVAQTPPTAAEAARYGGLLGAAHRGDLVRLAALLQGGAPLDERDSHGRSAVHLAAFARQREALRRLAAAGADLGALEHDRYDAVTIAAVADDEETLRLLLQLGASPQRVTSRYDGTALIAAAHLGHDGVVRQLVAAGAPLDHVNNLRWTALIESIVLGDGGPRHLATLRALLAAGANPNLADGHGRTPLALARGRGYAAMAAALEQAGARP
ncbi:ankyrin repeat domain-containing protein [Ideonella sp. A 288]|uniref:ankyrin repeat domain-containing protein n=1 Tax=Ideonella sp. A 288 TaxID=1962181 RepID=UPI000B4B4FA7|nr:ankyrin repeat domain-containing protein [Ideonella sp. A 288]